MVVFERQEIIEVLDADWIDGRVDGSRKFITYRHCRWSSFNSSDVGNLLFAGRCVSNTWEATNAFVAFIQMGIAGDSHGDDFQIKSKDHHRKDSIRFRQDRQGGFHYLYMPCPNRE